MPRTYVTKKAPTKKKMVAVAKRSYVRKSAPVRSAPLRTVTRARAPAKKSSSTGSALGTAIGSALGLALGGPGGGALGGMVGNAGGSFLSKIFGHGDYQVSNMAAVKENTLSNAANVPQFGTGKVSCNFKHREFLGDVISSSSANTFDIQSYSINPGLARTFPWLSDVVGASFQQYRINGMCFEFRSMSGDALNSVNTALGQVIMATDYDSADVPFTSKQQMENTEYGVSCKPSVNMMHAIECERSQTSISEQYIRAFAPPPNADVRLYDLGKFYIATNGCQGTSVNLGELWVTYDIDCFKAIEQVPNYLAFAAQYLLSTGATPAAPLGTAPTVAVGGFDNIGLQFTSTTFSFPYDIPLKSNWAFMLTFNSTNVALTPPAISFSNGFTTLAVYKAPSNASTGQTIVVYGMMTYANQSTPALRPTVTVAAYTGGTISAGFLDVYQVSGIPGAP